MKKGQKKFTEEEQKIKKYNCILKWRHKNRDKIKEYNKRNKYLQLIKWIDKNNINGNISYSKLINHIKLQMK